MVKPVLLLQRKQLQPIKRFSKKSPRDSSRGLLHSFAPFIDAQSRILILGTMPGPEALRRREYYGFPGNHFWRILFKLFETPVSFEKAKYADKIELLKREHIAIWDVIGSCRRVGASDSAIKNVEPNDIPGLLHKHPQLRAIFCNGQTSKKLFDKYFKSKITLNSFVLPSTSPAHASMSFQAKFESWRDIRRFLAAERPWC